MIKQPVNLQNLKFIILNNKGTSKPQAIVDKIIGKAVVIAPLVDALITSTALYIERKYKAAMIDSPALYLEQGIEEDNLALQEVDKAASGIDTLVVIGNSNFLGGLKAWISITMDIPLPPGIPPGSGSSIAISVKEKTFVVI